MAFNSLGDFITLLDHRKQLLRINSPVSPILEITEIADRISKGPSDKNKALLFENLPGYDYPVLINAFGSELRMAWALGVESLEDLNLKLAALIDLRFPQSRGEAFGRAKDLVSVLKTVGLRPKIIQIGRAHV
jgi:4-hydroxy-3-polyprenylbenzoate decarboxylase